MKLAECLTNSLSREGVISEEDKEIVQYGLESLGGDLLGFVLTFVIGVNFGNVLVAIFLWIWMYPLRKNAGGFHATTKIRCLLISTGLLVASFVIFWSSDYARVHYILYALGMGSVIWLMAPVDNNKKKLDSIEHKVYKRRSRKILILEEIILFIAVGFEVEVVMKSIVMSIFIVSVSLIGGTIKNICY